MCHLPIAYTFSKSGPIHAQYRCGAQTKKNGMAGKFAQRVHLWYTRYQFRQKKETHYAENLEKKEKKRLNEIANQKKIAAEKEMKRIEDYQHEQERQTQKKKENKPKKDLRPQAEGRRRGRGNNLLESRGRRCGWGQTRRGIKSGL